MFCGTPGFLGTLVGKHWFRDYWDVAPYSHVEVDRLLRGAYCLHNQGATSQKTLNLMLTAVRIWNLTYHVAVKVVGFGAVWVWKSIPVLYNPSASLPCHFSPWRWRQHFFRNVGIDLQIHTAPKPKTSKTVCDNYSSRSCAHSFIYLNGRI
jgi:hypothetical protein